MLFGVVKKAICIPSGGVFHYEIAVGLVLEREVQLDDEVVLNLS